MMDLNEYSGNVEPKELGLLRGAERAVHHEQAKVLGQVSPILRHLQAERDLINIKCATC